MSPRSIVIASVALIALTVPAYCAPEAAQFTGTWFCHWINTTPKGLHNNVKRTLHVAPNGNITEHIVNDLSVNRPSGRKTLHIEQACHTTSADVRDGVLITRWAPLEQIAPAPKDLPPGLHWQTGPFTLKFTRRGDKLVEVGEEDIVFTRVR